MPFNGVLKEIFGHFESFQLPLGDLYPARFAYYERDTLYMIYYSRLYFYSINAVLYWTRCKKICKTSRFVTPRRTFSSSDRIDDPLPRAKRRSNRRLINIHGYR